MAAEKSEKLLAIVRRIEKANKDLRKAKDDLRKYYEDQEKTDEP